MKDEKKHSYFYARDDLYCIVSLTIYALKASYSHLKFTSVRTWHVETLLYKGHVSKDILIFPPHLSRYGLLLLRTIQCALPMLSAITGVDSNLLLV